MWRDQIGYWIGVLVAVLTAVGIVTQLLKQRRDRASEARTELDASFRAGQTSRNDEVALLRSQRDDARNDRDEARRRLELFESRVFEYGPPTLPPRRPRPTDEDG